MTIKGQSLIVKSERPPPLFPIVGMDTSAGGLHLREDIERLKAQVAR